MRKTVIARLFGYALLLSGASCAPQSSAPTPSSTPTFLSPVSSADQKALAYARLLAFESFLKIDRTVKVTKGDVVCYSENGSTAVDLAHGYRRELTYVSRLGDLGESSLVESTTDVFKDGGKSYTLRDDGVYYSTPLEEEIKALVNPYDFSVLADGAYEPVGYGHVFTKNLSPAEARQFLQDPDRPDLGSFTLSVSVDSETVTGASYSYSQNGYAVAVTVAFSAADTAITLPTNVVKA